AWCVAIRVALVARPERACHQCHPTMPVRASREGRFATPFQGVPPENGGVTRRYLLRLAGPISPIRESVWIPADRARPARYSFPLSHRRSFNPPRELTLFALPDVGCAG